MARLGERVLDEGLKRFFASVYAERALVDHLHAKRGEHRCEFALLARVVGGENEALHALAARVFQAKPSDAFWATTRRLMPTRASPSIFSICSAENGAFSAVAWTSTNAPEPVITTFMS